MQSMKEMQPFELTGQAGNAYSSDRGNFMPDGPGSGEGTPIPGPERADPGGRPVEPTREISSEDQMRIAMLQGALTRDPYMNNETRGAIVNLIHDYGGEVPSLPPIGTENAGYSGALDPVGRAFTETSDSGSGTRAEPPMSNRRDSVPREGAPLGGLSMADAGREEEESEMLDITSDAVRAGLEHMGFEIDPDLTDEVLRSSYGFFFNAAGKANNRISRKLRGHSLEDMGDQDRIGMYLKAEDARMLNKDPLAWISDKFNTLYTLADQGQELDSPTVQNIQSLFGEAYEYVSSYRKDSQPELVQRFSSEFLDNLNLIFMRSTIEQRNLEGAKGMAKRTGAKTIFRAMTYEDGNVGRMFGRMQEYYEDTRLSEGIGEARKIQPDTEAKLQDTLVSQELELARNGIGRYGKEYKKIEEEIRSKMDEGPSERQAILMRFILNKQGIKVSDATQDQISNAYEEAITGEIEERVEMDITRAVRTAYNLFIITQRHAVINSRSGALYHSDDHSIEHFREYLGVAGAAFASFNAEAMLWEEFRILNHHDMAIARAIKIDMARSDLEKRNKGKSRSERIEMTDEELLEHGRVLFRDFFTVPDFFSSGWRMGGMITKLDEYGERKRAEGDTEFDSENFGLFVRLRNAHSTGKEAEVKNIWGRISKYRPEEIVKLFRDREGSNKGLETLYAEMRKQGISLTAEEKRTGLTEYDVFKREYGSILSDIRDQGFKSTRQRQINFADLEKDADFKRFKDQIDILRGTGATQKVIEIYKAMQAFSNDSDIGAVKRLMKDPKFGDIYSRVLVADDLLLGDLETKAEDLKLVSLSRSLSVDNGTDALVRNYNDLEHAGNAMVALLTFIKTEDMEERIRAAREFAEEASMYGGQKQRAKSVRYTVGTIYILAKKHKWADVMNFDKGFGRRAVSELQKIYGPQAAAIDREELREKLDEIHLLLVDAFDADDPEAMYHALEKLLEVTGADIRKLHTESAFLLLIIAAGLIAPTAFKEGLDMSKVEGFN